MTRVRAYTFLAAVVVAATTGCGTTPPNSSPSSTPTVTDSQGVSTSPSPRSTAAPEPISAHGVVTLSDSTGYKIEVSYKLASAAPTADPSSQPPGKTLVTIPGALTIALTNKTSARNAIVDPLYLEPVGLYPARSLPCSAAGTPTANGGYCLVKLGAPINFEFANMEGQTQLSAAGSIARTNASTSNNPLAMAAMVVSEGLAPALIKALQHPTAVVIESADPSGTNRWSTLRECDATLNPGDGTSPSVALWGPAPLTVCH